MLTGVAYKVASTFVFACMLALVKAYSAYPVGELVFFRSFFALGVLVAWLIPRREFPRALHTRWLGGHLVRSISGSGSMFLLFAAYAFLPLADVTAVNYANPLMIVILAGLWLKEPVGPMRWLAVALGFSGILLMLWEHMGGASSDAPNAVVGVFLALGAAFCVAIAMIQTRRLVRTEHIGAVIFYFQATTAVFGIVLMGIGGVWPDRWPFAPFVQAQAWIMPRGMDWVALVWVGLFGGLGQILMTRSYSLADASIIACFEYSSMIWILILGAVFLNEFPSALVLVGAAIVTAAGLLVIFSERRKRFL